MADNDTSKIRYDDFIGSVQPDPAKPESTIMLSGFVGHGSEGHARIYPDPTLGTWYDVPEGDVLHSMPIADSKLGGSYIWVRASSEIKPGGAAPAATEAEAVQPQQAVAVGMTPTPRTHCRVCNPPEAAAVMQPTPTPATHCFICPPHTQNCTPATICTLHGHCPQPQPSVPPTLCAVPQTLPCSLLCQAAAAPAAMALPHTAATVCTQFGCPPHTMVPTVWCSWVGCAPHGPAGAAPAGLEAAPQAAAHAGALPQTHFLCTQGLATFCGCTPGIDCNAPAPQPPHQTHFLCTQGLATFCGCTPGIDCMGLAARAAPQQANATAVTVCVTDCQPPGNQIRAAVGNPMDPTPQSRCFVCDPPNMLAAMQPTPTVQTHCFICPPHTLGMQCWTAPVVCGIMPPSVGCTQNCQQGGAAQQEGVAPQGLRTSWFECHTKMPGCTVHICAQAAPQAQAFLGPPFPHTVGGGAISQCFCPSAFHQCGGQTVLTQIGCPTHQIHCPTQPVVCNLQPTQPVVCGVLPPSFGCTQGCQQGGAQQQPGAMAAPAHPNTAATVCTQFGCTFAGCTPQHPGGGFTPATVCTQPNGVFTPFGR